MEMLSTEQVAALALRRRVWWCGKPSGLAHCSWLLSGGTGPMSGNRRARAGRFSSEEALLGRPVQQLPATHRLQLQQGPRPDVSLLAPRRGAPDAVSRAREVLAACSGPVQVQGTIPTASAVVAPVPAPGPRQRRVLKLTDDEILGLYRDAQREAGKEADWRGIQLPTASGGSSDGDGTSGTSALPGSGESCQQECLRMLSRALQQPGRSPRELAAQILDSSRDQVCCRPRVDAMLEGNLGSAWTCTDEAAGPKDR
mmetsp:Transcript_3709/g.10804  ORF Transcript_3709/g.10804 Transcript_3709/m.10804 type:complete len:256 (-) Transcript_3709:150-917(-)